MAPTGSEVAARAEVELGRALVVLHQAAQQYPVLASSSAYSELARQLAETEALLQRTRSFYNDAVMRYRNLAGQIGGRLLAGPATGGTALPAYFQADQAANTAPRLTAQRK